MFEEETKCDKFELCGSPLLANGFLPIRWHLVGFQLQRLADVSELRSFAIAIKIIDFPGYSCSNQGNCYPDPGILPHGRRL